MFEAVNRFRSMTYRVNVVIAIGTLWGGMLPFLLGALRDWIAHEPDPLDNAAWLAVLLFQAITIGTTAGFELLIRPSSRLAALRLVPSALAFVVIVALAYFAPARGPRAGTVALYAEAIAGGAYVAFVARSWRRGSGNRTLAELPRATARQSGRTQ